MTKEETEALIGFTIPDDIWEFTPWGNRLLVRRLDPETSYGSIVIPDSARREVSAGVIVKVGHEVGYLSSNRSSILLPPSFCMASYPVDVLEGGASDPIPDQDALVGLLITFGHWGGEAIHPSQKQTLVESAYDTTWLLIQAFDIWGHNGLVPYGHRKGKEEHGIPTHEVQS